MAIIGTAGHVDHGKSTLVEALTGIDPDRLAEEKRRGLTVDLGFAHLDLPGGGRAGIVDVPGHSRFLHNMLAGVHGMDAVVLVVAADEGVMPQTREHLDILHLVGVDRLVVALTKVEMVEDDVVDIARREVRQELSRRGLGAAILPVSARRRSGLEELTAELARLVAASPPPPPGPARLPIDRAFTMPGFGVVVTGSLAEGELALDQELEVVPVLSGSRPARGRVRGLQQHGNAVARVAAGNRVAVNLQGIQLGEVGRGQVLAPPGTLASRQRLEVRLEVLPGATLRHNARLKLYSGTAETLARVVSNSERIQLRLARAVAVRPGDRVVLRRPSPSETVAGGEVLEAAEPDVAPRALRALEAYHRRHPLRAGMPARELGHPADELVARGVIESRGGGLVALPGFAPQLSAAQRRAVDAALARLREAPLAPPAAAELGLGEDLVLYLEQQRLVARLGPAILLLPETLAAATAAIRGHLDAAGSLTVAQARDVLGSSRRVVVPLLEHLDAQRVTLREGDVRRLRR